MSNAIIEMLHLGYLSTEEINEVLGRIVNDSFVLKSAQTLAINAQIVSAIQNMHSVERDALVKRVLKVNKPMPRWSLEKGHDESGDFFTLSARCPQPHCRAVKRWQAPAPPFGSLPRTPAEIENCIARMSFRCVCSLGESPAPEAIRNEWKAVLERFLQ